MIVNSKMFGSELRHQVRAVKANAAGSILLCPRMGDEIPGPQSAPWLRAHGVKLHHAAASPTAHPYNLALFRRALGLEPGDKSSGQPGEWVATLDSALPTNQLREFSQALPLVRRLRLINQPTVIWLDRLQFGDAGSVAMIGRVRPLLPSLPLLLVATWQSGVTAALDDLRAVLP